MRDSVDAELLKVRSTRTTVGLVVAMGALVVLLVLLTGLLTAPSALTTSSQQRSLLTVGGLSGVFSALAGVLLVTSELRFGTIRPTFLCTPRRATVMGAKLLVGLIAGVAFGVVGEGGGFLIGYLCLRGRGIPYALSGGATVQVLLGTIAGVALWGAMGVGVAGIVRNQVGTIVGMLAWAFVVESLLFAFVPSVGRLTPGEAQDALSGMTGSQLLSAPAGALVLIGWTAALGAAGTALIVARDVS